MARNRTQQHSDQDTTPGLSWQYPKRVVGEKLPLNSLTRSWCNRVFATVIEIPGELCCSRGIQIRQRLSERNSYIVVGARKAERYGSQWVVLPRIEYRLSNAQVETKQLLIDGQPTVEFIEFMFDRLSCFVEDFTAHCLQCRMHQGVAIT